MNTPATISPAPEERELRKKQVEVARLEEDLAQRELELETCRGKLTAFEQRYLQIVVIW